MTPRHNPLRFSARRALGWITAATLIAVTGRPAGAMAVFIELRRSDVRAGKIETHGFVFQITSQRLDAETRFRVVIDEKGGTFDETPTLSVSRLTERGESIDLASLRKLDVYRDGHTARSEFRWPSVELADPSIVFVFWSPVFADINGQRVGMPSATVFFARLKTF